VKISRYILVLFALASVPVSAQPPQKPKGDPQWNITAECQMIIVPQKVALPLLPDLLDESKIESVFSKLQALIGDGEAELAALLVTKAQDNDKGVAESVEEMRYGTEFDPPQLPPNTPENSAILKDWPIIGVTPTSFETRNIGTTLEFQAAVKQAGRQLSITAVPQHVRFLRWTKTDAGKLANGEHLHVEQPVFHSMRDTASLLLKNGQRVLRGVHKVPDRADQMELFFLQVEAKPTAPK